MLSESAPAAGQTPEVRLDSVKAGTFVAYYLFAVEDEAWIDPRGEKVLVAK